MRFSRASLEAPKRWRSRPGARALAGIAMCLFMLSAGRASAGGNEFPKATNSIGLSNRAGEWKAMIGQVEPLVKKLGGEKSEEERKKIEDRLVNEFGEKAIECLIRYREPHLIPVFTRLLEHKQWFVRRLAIFGLERNNAITELKGVAKRLDDESFLVREIAAITLCLLHTRGKVHFKEFVRNREMMKTVKGLRKAKKGHIEALKARSGKEENPFVKSAIEAAIQGLKKRLPVRIHEEPTVGEAPIRRIPHGSAGSFGEWSSIKYKKQGGGSKHPPTKGWGYPVIVYPREILTVTSDPPLKPLPRKNNSFHFGHDCGWFLEGSGIYAIADGVVRMVQHGGDWGGLIVVEHHFKGGYYVNALNGHCGMWLFAEAGRRVKKGQLLGVMGLGFSPENGGHGAHDHFGMFTNAFDAGKCYGRGPAGRSLKGWLIPADFLGPKVEGKRIKPESYK